MTRPLPPRRRSWPALAMTAPAAERRFSLPSCEACGRVHYPPQEFCPDCLSERIAWQDASRRGQLMAEAALHHSLEPAFRAAIPFRTGLVRHESGAILVAFLDGECTAGGPVRLDLVLDRGGAPVVTATPQGQENDMVPASHDPKNRVCLVTEDRSPLARAVIEALKGVGAREVHVWPEGELDCPRGGTFEELSLVADTAWLGRADAPIADHLSRMQALAESVAPVLEHTSGCWVFPLSFAALMPYPVAPVHSARMAAAQAWAVTMRQRLQRAGGTAFAIYPSLPDVTDLGGTEGRLSPERLAAALVGGLRRGEEDMFPDSLAEMWNSRLGPGRKSLERDMERHGDCRSASAANSLS